MSEVVDFLMFLDKNEARMRYEATVRVYERRYSDIQAAKIKEVLRRLKGASFGLVLDVGCGPGLLLPFLPDCEIVCLDFSLGMLEVIREKKFPCFLVLGDSDWLPLRDSVFDCVFSFTVLQNLPDPLASLREMSRVVKKGGKVVVTVLKKRLDGEELKKVCLEAGLSVLDVFPASVEDVCAICVKKS